MDIDDREGPRQLLAAIKATLPALERLRDSASDHWGYEDPIYRFYHQSFKVYWLQQETVEIVKALRGLAGGEGKLDRWFEQIVAEGTGHEFDAEHNKRWLEATRPIVEAFFHSKYFIEMVCRYGKTLDSPPQVLPSGWAAVLTLFGMR